MRHQRFIQPLLSFVFVAICPHWGLLASDPPSNSSSPAVESTAIATINNQLSLAELRDVGASRSQFKSAVDSLAKLKGPINGSELPTANLAEYETVIQPILQQNCVACHGPDDTQGNVRIDTLNPNLAAGSDTDWWSEVLAVLTKGEMPPPDENDMSDQDRGKVVQWLAQELQTASIVRRNKTPHTAFRRLTRYEYNYALQDLLGVPWDFAKDLPPESASEDGFENSSDLLHLSVSQFETYHRAARSALQRVTVTTGEAPMTLHWGVSMADAASRLWDKQADEAKKAEQQFWSEPERLETELARLDRSFRKPHRTAYYKELFSGRTAPAEWDYYNAEYAVTPSANVPDFPKTVSTVAVLPAGVPQKLVVELGNQLPDEGIMRVTARVSRANIDNDFYPSLQLLFGWQASNEGRALLRVSDQDIAIIATPENPQIVQWDVPLGEIYPRNSVRKSSPMGTTPSPSEYIRLANSSASPADIQVDFVHVAAPVSDTWPPESHQRIFFSSEKEKDEKAYAREILTNFMSRAWRRELTDTELQQKLALFEVVRTKCDSFAEAIVEVLATVLSSPHFLYVSNNPVQPDSTLTITSTHISQFAVANRLALFLWCSIPDEQLLDLAKDGKLADSQILSSQVERMLADSRSKRFAKHFVHQWLNLSLLEFVDFEQQNRGVDPLLKEAMQQEPIEFFSEVLQANSSIIDFLHADFAVVNQRLAKHYGIDNISGNNFRRVKLDGKFKRGGLLTQAGLLAMNSDWPDSHPLKRAIWLLEKLLNDPPPPPPPAVPQIDLANPEIAKMTLKERIEDHRNHAACVSCHAKIDPWGIAFENYDALGRWRDEIAGKPIDASSQLYNHQSIDGMDGLKRFLLENRQDQFVQAMVHKLSTYALGRPLTFADRADIDAITATARREGDGLKDIIKSLVQSDLFWSM